MTKAANAWGLYDMAGNVWEWCGDWYGSYPGGSVTDWVGPGSTPYRVMRGGSWFDAGRRCRSGQREFTPPGIWDNTIGFRAVLAPSQ